MAKKSSKASKPSGNMMMKQKDMMMPGMPMMNSKQMGAKMGSKPKSSKKSSKRGK